MGRAALSLLPKGFVMRGFIAHRKNRRDRQNAAYNVGFAAGAASTAGGVTIINVAGDVSNASLVITFSSNVSTLPTWAASALVITNNGGAVTDTSWSQTAANQITVPCSTLLVIGTVQVTPGPAALAIGFVSGGLLSGNPAGGGVVA